MENDNEEFTKEELREFQSWFLAYCSAMGNRPTRQLEIDQKRYIGQAMTGYISWIREKRRIWEKKCKETDFEEWVWETRHEIICMP